MSQVKIKSSNAHLKLSRTKPPLSAMKTLIELSNYNLFKRYPEVPYLPKNKYEDRTANGLTRCVVDWIRLNGGQAERINVTGRPVDQRKVVSDCLGFRRQIGSVTWIPGTGTKGSADISATIKGRSVKVEVKIGRDQQSEYQQKYQGEIEESGGLYFIATSFEQFHQWYKQSFE